VAGLVDFRVVAVVVFRTGLITDEVVLANIDARLAVAAPGWNGLSRRRVTELVDWRVRELDPAAERVARDADADRHVEFGPVGNGVAGLAEFWGVVRAPDAAVLDRRLDLLAGTVCAGDSRTKRQRRADALAALAAGQDSMVCDCGSQQCPAADVDAAPAQVVIHVVAEQATVSGEGTAPGYLPGFGAVAAQTVRDLAARARVRPLKSAPDLTAELQYRPSVALAEFIRARDLWCRFPGCDVAAQFCDLDHSIPWMAGGLTHPSNIHLKCRPHHLLKTFWCGENGWSEQQFPDGTIVWTSPSGRSYTTTPGGALFFPQLGTPTETLTTVKYPRFCSDPYRRIRTMPRQYSPEFRQRALRLLDTMMEASETSEFEAIKSVASKLGVSEESVRRWRRKSQVDAGQRPGMTSGEHAEVRRLKREVAELRRANEILKSASAFFAAELDRPATK